MRTYRSTHTIAPPQRGPGFGNLTEHAIHTGIAAIGDLLDGSSSHHPPA